MDFIMTTPVKPLTRRRLTFFQTAFLNSTNGHRIRTYFFWILYGMASLTGDPATSFGAEVDNLVIDSSRDHLVLSVAIHDIVTGEVTAAPEADVSATIVFSIALYEVKPFWFNKKIAHHTAINSIKRNSKLNAYRLLRSWDSGPPLKVDSLDKARRWMAEINNFKVMPLSGLEKGRTYQIRVRAVCQNKNAFIFSPSECFKTDWHTLEFTL